MMNMRLIWASAFVSLTRNKARTFLTTLGVIIGVLAVILLVSIGNGLKGLVTTQFASLGSNLLYVAPGELLNQSGGFSQSGPGQSKSKFNIADGATIAKIGDPITLVAPLIQSGAEIRYGTKKNNGTLTITTPEYGVMRNFTAAQGRFLSASDNDGKRKVVVLGPKIKDKLFGSADAIGKEVTVSNIRFTVIGVLEAKAAGGFGGPDIDSFAYIPFETGRATLDYTAPQFFLAQISKDTEVARGKALITRALLRRLKADDFSVTDQSEILKTINTILSAVTGALTGIAAISLLVGGIGIMNIMLVSVAERTKEIGLRKALGATPNVIMVQFLIEAATLSSAGGIVGILLGIGISAVINQFVPATPSVGSVALAFFVSWMTGVIFGVVPARKAAQLSPIEALRYE